MGERYWRAAEPKPAYDVVIVGAGGHGLATAYYLAANHGITDVCVVEKGWLGGGNMARNTTIIRSNYLWDESAAIYEHSLKLWETLEETLGFDMQFSQRGVLNLAHDLGDVRSSVRRVEANRLNGVDAEWLDADGVKGFAPIVNTSPDVRYPVLGGTLQRRGGVARHDKVAWGYARGADRLGVDIVEHAEVTGFLRGDGGRVEGVETSRGTIRAEKVALAAAGHTSVLASMVRAPAPRAVASSAGARERALRAGARLRGDVERGARVRLAGRQGRARDGRGHRRLQRVRPARVVPRDRAPDGGGARAVPDVRARRSVLRTWGGIVDVCPDASPIVDRTPIDGLFVNCGWGTGGFKGTPGSGWIYAETIATGEPGELARPFSLDRFTTGALIDEHGAAAVAH